MNLYFDTNVYRFITERGEASQVAALFDRYGCRLAVSAGNLFETYAVGSSSDRAKEMKTIARLGRDYSPQPESYLHALEVQREIRRLRRQWINPVPHKREIRTLLKGHQDLWTRVLNGELPSSSDFASYSDDAEQGIATARCFQKDLRALFLDPARDFELRTPSGHTVSVNVEDPEVFWRFEGLSVWYEAIVRENPASRDYADWLKPFLKRHAFADPSYLSFWLHDADADAMPLNRLTGLVSYYQLKQKITHGNSADQIHASCWLMHNLFVTADRAFHEALASAARHYPRHRAPALVNREDPSFASQLDSILRAAANLV